jgi:hypothetical protein
MPCQDHVQNPAGDWLAFRCSRSSSFSLAKHGDSTLKEANCYQPHSSMTFKSQQSYNLIQCYISILQLLTMWPKINLGLWQNILKHNSSLRLFLKSLVKGSLLKNIYCILTSHMASYVTLLKQSLSTVFLKQYGM